MRSMVYLLVAVNEWMHGVVFSLCSFMTLGNLFFRKTGRYGVFSVLAGTALSLGITTAALLTEGTTDITPVMAAFYLLHTCAGWFLLTDRSRDAGVSVVFAEIFSASVIASVRTIIFSVTTITAEMQWMQYVWYALIYLFSLLFLVLLGWIAKGEEREPLSKWNMLLLTGIVSVMILVVQSSFALSEDAADVAPAAAIPVALIFLFAAALVMLSLRDAQAAYLRRLNGINEAYLTSQARHFEKAREADAEMRMLRHDMKNHILVLNGLYKAEKYDELGDYLSQISGAVTELQAAVITGNEIADAILTEKMADARREHAEILVDGDLRGLHISSLKLCTILSNLLDNALEAVRAVPPERRTIFVDVKKTGSFIYISVKNHTAAFVDTSGDAGTSKADKVNHGFGLKNIRNAVNACGGTLDLRCEQQPEGYMFLAEIVLPMKAEKESSTG